MPPANNYVLESTAPQILLVDDELDILPEFQELLDLEGLDSAICADPEQAAQIVLSEPDFRLVITDLRMAKLDGGSLIRLLRQRLPQTRRVNFIILTGDASSQISEDIGDVPVFLKPVNTNALLPAIRSALASTL